MVDWEAHDEDKEAGLLQLPTALAGLKGRRVLQVSGTLYPALPAHPSGTSAHALLLLLLEAGGVMSFGCGRHGQLGHGDDENQHTPKLVEALRGKKVLKPV